MVVVVGLVSGVMVVGAGGGGASCLQQRCLHSKACGPLGRLVWGKEEASAACCSSCAAQARAAPRVQPKQGPHAVRRGISSDRVSTGWQGGEACSRVKEHPAAVPGRSSRHAALPIVLALQQWHRFIAFDHGLEQRNRGAIAGRNNAEKDQRAAADGGMCAHT